MFFIFAMTASIFAEGFVTVSWMPDQVRDDVEYDAATAPHVIAGLTRNPVSMPPASSICEPLTIGTARLRI